MATKDQPPEYTTLAGAPQGQGFGMTGGAQAPQYNTTYNTQYTEPAPVMYEPKPYEDDHTVTVFDNLQSNSFSDKAIRMAFIRKVYMILMSQLLITFGVVLIFSFVNPVKEFVQRHFYLYIIAYVLFLVVYIVLACCGNVRRSFPGNYISLGIFTLVFSYMAGAIASFHKTDAVLICMGITVLVCLSVSLFACQTKIDFTMCTGLLFCLVLVLVLFGFSCLIVHFTLGPSKILHAVYGGLGALVFSLFLAYDTQVVIGGKKYELDPEEYVFGALQLYIDVVYIFLMILMIFGGSKN